MLNHGQQASAHGGGASFIVKVPWDVLPARVYFLPILVDSSLGKGIILAI